MATPEGRPVWYELVSGEPAAAEGFYADVLNWRFTTPPGAGPSGYRMALAGQSPVAGMMPLGQDTSMMPRWLIYFAVDDVDARAAAASGLGAAVHVPPTDIPGVGRFAFLTDPQGQPFYLLRRDDGAAADAFACGLDAAPGHAAWNELCAPEPDAALGFYASLLSIRAEGAMPMGDLGLYRFIHAGADCIGAIMGPVPGSRPGWQVYFVVDDIDAALARVTQSGGRVVQEPLEIPGGAFSMVAEDREAARFGLVGPRHGAPMAM